ncbi:MAG: ATP-binding protein [Candidatus Brevundimonas colombiensis]|uniref:histidine kinase n=1 Tax=Candidatus Brevundimonas colombiensis TaxID=3121376 RepID=A0AAJ5WY52_9CAUL|nr:ATP-binding protein [Brevundimonas sp.]WEK40496.1 MAG: ATP-binding protein [Brevundimonas sp.]
MSPDQGDRRVAAGFGALLSRYRTRTWLGGAVVAVLAVSAAMALRLALSPVAHFYYLPVMPAIMATALLGRRSSVSLAIVLAIIGCELVVRRDSLTDTLANAGLFVVVAWAVAETCFRLRAAMEAAQTLARDLARRELLLDSILTSTPIVTLDRDGRTRRVTQVAASLLGVTPSRALNQPFETLLPGFDAAAVQATQRSDGAARMLWRAPGGPNGEAALLTLGAHQLPPDAAPEHTVLTLTDQSQAEAARRRERELNDRLSSVWRLNSMGEMAATLAHELNQPLSAAAVYLHAGQADLARIGPAADPTVRTLDLAKSQVLRAGDIIRRMREMIANGSRAFTEERASQMIQDLQPVTALIGQDTGVAIRIETDDEDDQVLADRIQFQQALTNLIRNAVDAVIDRDDGQVTVIGRTLGPDGYDISVRDNGPGIPDAQMDHIFHPMISTKTGGMGLGLSVTRTIVESHGSALVVTRPKGGGACFTFRLSRPTESEAA